VEWLSHRPCARSNMDWSRDSNYEQVDAMSARGQNSPSPRPGRVRSTPESRRTCAAPRNVGPCHDRTSQRRAAVEPRPNDDYDQKMRRLLVILSLVFLMPMLSAQAQPALTVDPESIVPLPEKFDLETPAPAVPLEIARFQGAWIGTWRTTGTS
jgi:hypothetical protein